jgi:hypothetical protein
MQTRARRSCPTGRRVAGVRLRTGLTGRKGCKTRGPGIASRADGTGLTGRDRQSRSPAECPIAWALTQSSQTSTKASGGCQSPGTSSAKRAGGRASHSGAGTHLCVPSRTRAVTGRYRPIDIDRSPERLCPESTQLRFRPVRPAQSAWHEMPGDASARASSPCVPASMQMQTRARRSQTTGRRVAGVRLRTGLTGRKRRSGRGPGLHPGLMELALQAAIAKVAPQQNVQLHGL